MADPDFYLKSNEGYGLQEPRKCYRIKRLKGKFRDDYLIIQLDPPLTVNLDGFVTRISKALIATRFKDESLFPIKAWPVDIHLFYIADNNIDKKDVVDEDDLTNIAWAELFETEASALQGKI